MAIYRHQVIILFSCLCFCPSAFTQQAMKPLTNIGVQEGLSNNEVTDIIQDDLGFLWIATSNGLNRYDGTEITHWFQQENDYSLPGNRVTCLKKIAGNRLAVGTREGLGFYDALTNRFTNFYYKSGSPALDLYNNHITLLETDTAGNLWVGSRNAIFIFDSSRVLSKIFHSGFSAADAETKRLNWVEKILPMSDGKMLLCLYNGWYLSSATDHRLVRIEESGAEAIKSILPPVQAPFSSSGGIENFSSAAVFKIYQKYFLHIKAGKDSLFLSGETGNLISAIYFPFNRYPFISWTHKVVSLDSQQLAFIFHHKGLALIQLQWKNGEPQLIGSEKQTMENLEFSTVVADREGNWWLGTTGMGIQKFSPQKHVILARMLTDPKSGKTAEYEVSQMISSGNNFWVSTYGSGLFLLDADAKPLEHFLFAQSINIPWEDFIWNLRESGRDSFWLGTQAGLRLFNKKTGRLGMIPGIKNKPAELDTVPVTIQYTDRSGRVWLGMGRGKGLAVYYPWSNEMEWFHEKSAQPYPLRYPIDAAESSTGDLWFASDASSMLVLRDQQQQVFRKISVPLVSGHPVSHIKSVFLENDTVLWLGTVNSGLIRFNPLTNQASIFNFTNAGIPGTEINDICIDAGGKLWLATHSGLCSFNPQTFEFSLLDESDGLPAGLTSTTLYPVPGTSAIMSGGYGSIYSFMPDKIRGHSDTSAPLISYIRVNDSLITFPGGRVYSFAADQNNITIGFTAINLTNGPQTSYEYKLIGDDLEWMPLGKQRQINFSRLPHGKYSFLVRSKNRWGKWTEEVASLEFNIRAPFFRSPWFFALLFLFLLFLLSQLVRIRRQRRAITEQIRSDISRNLHDEVGSTLTNISLSSLLAQKHPENVTSVKQILERIYHDSQEVSRSLREIVWSINPKIETLGEMLPRMLQYAAEILEAKDIELQVEHDNEIDKIRLDMQKRLDFYMIFKEAMNNMARHSEASHASVRFQLTRRLLTMTVRDDGQGFDPKAPTINNGLRNMRKRAEKNGWEFRLETSKGKGTRVELKLMT